MFSVMVSFPLVDDPSTSLLPWTTTHWTFPSDLALFVNPNYTCIKIEDQKRKQNFIPHENLLRTVLKIPNKTKFIGSEMKRRYVPLFDYFMEKIGGPPSTAQNGDKSFRVLTDIYVPILTVQASFTKPPHSVTMVIVSYSHIV